ncbi:DJ-1/PfpI family protein [Nonomuraea sp. NPDC050536]|uniref:DJ-1/PfpI family protein n=1 Tax=Nonomuraea sp. NPDC050536 TaxID=3364366 RepID=UPI0037C703BE
MSETKKTVHVAIYDGLADWEAGYATAHINRDLWQQRPGTFQVVTVARTFDPITTLGGNRIVPDMTLDDLDPADSEMLILAGSDDWITGELDDFGRKAAEFLDAGTPVAAICGATAGMARQGLFNERPHTSAVVEFLQAQEAYKGAECYVDADAVTGGDLISAGPTEPVAFAREIFAKLDLYTPEKLDAWYRLYGKSDPAAFFDLMAG